MSLITLEEIYKSGTKLTPMMSQYYEIKKQHIDDIVFSNGRLLRSLF